MLIEIKHLIMDNIGLKFSKSCRKFEYWNILELRVSHLFEKLSINSSRHLENNLFVTHTFF